MPLYAVTPTLQGFAQSDDYWFYLTQHLSLADLGNLNSVSRVFHGATRPRTVERAALDFIRQEERGAVTAQALHQFRCHPATRNLVDSGLHATACVQSLYLARQAVANGMVHSTVRTLELPGRMQCLDVLPQTRDGRVVCWNTETGSNQPIRHLVRAGRVLPFALPDGLAASARTASLGGISAARQFLVPQPDYWALTNRDRALHVWRADTAQLTSVPLQSPGRVHMSAVSGNGRFVAMAAAGLNGGGRMQCYDREQDLRCVDRNIVDSLFCQLSVADDGKLFVGSHLQGYQLSPDGMLKIVPFLHQYNSLYTLSPDERFLIRSGVHGSDDIGAITLEDLWCGPEIFLPRLQPLRPGGWSLRPASIAFSALNALVAIAYHDGVIQVFDLSRGRACPVASMGEMEFADSTVLMQPHVSFDGFDRVHTVFRHFSGEDIVLRVHTLNLGHQGEG